MHTIMYMYTEVSMYMYNVHELWYQTQCTYLTFVMDPTHCDLSLKMSLWPLSNASLLLLLRCIFVVCPVLPNIVMKTLASVPPPFWLPVTATISYSEEIMRTGPEMPCAYMFRLGSMFLVGELCLLNHY